MNHCDRAVGRREEKAIARMHQRADTAEISIRRVDSGITGWRHVQGRTPIERGPGASNTKFSSHGFTEAPGQLGRVPAVQGLPVLDRLRDSDAAADQIRRYPYA